ncbi:MAG: membrane dipeptidase [Clostridia bacterium]|nr:membrane dipeptidase [Clostridia bacterium]
MFIADTHSDTLYALGVHKAKPDSLMITPEKLRTGGISLQTFALWTGPKGREGDVNAIVHAELGARAVMEKAGIHQVDDPDEVGDGEHAFMLSVEGGEVFEDGAYLVEDYRRLGVRMVALTWNHENRIGFPAKSGASTGLTSFGLTVVREMQKEHMAVDVSHLNEAGFYDIFAHTDVPPMASHSCCSALCPHFRNLTDDQIRLMIREGGYIGINFYPSFLSAEGKADIATVVRHIDHICQMGGQKIVGFGSDFDGIETTPQGLEGADCIPALLEALKAAGMSSSDVEGIAGENLRSYFRRINAY